MFDWMRHRASALWATAFLAAAGRGCGSDDRKPFDSPAPPTVDADWYKEVVFYQIYPRSFKDSDGDGIGDLNGITEKLDYLADLGVGGIWLNPIYPTLNVDLGYDITDHQGINPEFGSLADLDRLLSEAHRRNIRVFLDLAINDTSKEHPWFQESRSGRNSPKRDWFIWSPEPGFRCDDISPIGSPFGESRWEQDPVTGEFYYHQFYADMPDLNFKNPEVRQALMDVAKFWLGRGVDGFRLDAVSFYDEDAAANLCMNQPGTHAFLRELRGGLDSFDRKAMVGEVLLKPDDVIPYLGNGSDELHMYFNFHLVPLFLQAALGGNVEGLIRGLEDTFAKFPPGGHHALVVGNHDLPRAFSLIGESRERAKLLASLQLLLPGTPFIYYGDEIGISNGEQIRVDWRDIARTPMAWDASEGGGFSSGTPWIRPSAGGGEKNVVTEAADKDSLLYHYRKLIRLRNALPALRSPSYRTMPTGDDSLLAVYRGGDSSGVIVVVNAAVREKMIALDMALLPVESTPGEWSDVWNERLVTRESGVLRLTLAPFGVSVLRPGQGR